MDRGAKVVVIGKQPAAESVCTVLTELLAAVRKGYTPAESDVEYALSRLGVAEASETTALLTQQHGAIRAEMRIRPRTAGQKRYLDTLTSHEIAVAIGPAGTGKTYLAMAVAVSFLLNKQVKRLVLTRPAVEAGERLGFLPGDLVDKVNPYLRPLYDALYSMVDMERVNRLIDQECIEVAPLAFMRGRTLDNAFVILDEAQNTTREQMLMFLTRLGQKSRMVVTGDITQIDLPVGVKSGLVDAREVLANIRDIGIVHLGKQDVVRNPLVQKIVHAYENAGQPEPHALTDRESDVSYGNEEKRPDRVEFPPESLTNIQGYSSSDSSSK